jgi:hypothetical protein
MQALESIKDLFRCVKILHGYTLVINGLRILGVLMGSQNFVTHFLDEVLS